MWPIPEPFLLTEYTPALVARAPVPTICYQLVVPPPHPEVSSETSDPLVCPLRTSLALVVLWVCALVDGVCSCAWCVVLWMVLARHQYLGAANRLAVEIGCIWMVCK